MRRCYSIPLAPSAVEALVAVLVGFDADLLDVLDAAFKRRRRFFGREYMARSPRRAAAAT